MTDAGMRSLVVYSREGCHLCEQLIEELLPMIRGTLDLDVRDIDRRADWQVEFNTRIPVVEFEGEFICQYTLDRLAIQTIVTRLAEP